MQEPLSSAVAGAVGGALYAADRTMERNERRTRRAESLASSAEDKATEALSKLSHMGIGDIERISADRFADFANGVAYPATQPAPVPSTYPTPPVPPARPVFSQDMAGAVGAYPGTTNQYNEDGKLVDPGSPFTGQNFATGLALSSVEVRAALMGLLKRQTENPSREHLEAIFRLFQGLTLGVEGNTQSQDEITAAIQRMLSFQPSGYRKIAQWFSAAGVPVVGASTETVVFELNVSAGQIVNPGDELDFKFDGQQVSTNGADQTTIRLRQGSVSGPVLVTLNANLPVTPISWRLAAVYLGSSQMRFAGPVFTSGAATANVTGTFDPTVDQKLVMTCQHSTNNAANITRFDQSSIWLGR